MRKPTTLALATLLIGPLAVSPTASEADDRGLRFSVGSHFRIGGLDVALVFGDRGPRYAPYPYYRFPRRIAYRGYHCTDRCFVRGGHYYHARSCPVAGVYFRSHRFDPGHFWVRPAPRVVYSYPPPPGYWAPPGHRRHGRYWAPPRHRGYRDHGHYKHDRRREYRHGPRRGHRGHWEWDDGRWEWDDDDDDDD